MSEDAAIAVLDNHRGEGRASVERGHFAAQQRFKPALQQRIDRRALLRGTRCGVAQRPRQMRRVKRQSQPTRRDRLAARLGQHLRGDDALVGHSDQDPVASRARGVGVAIGTQPLRRARNGDQKRRLGRRQPCRFLVEIGQACRSQALEIAAERRQSHIDRQDIVLPKRRSRPSASAISTSFAASVRGRRSSSRTVCIVKCRGAGDDTEICHELADGAHDRGGVDAGMAVEPAILGGDKHPPIERIDAIDGKRQAPLVIGGQKAAQDRTVTRQNQDRQIAAAIERRRWQHQPDAAQRPQAAAIAIAAATARRLIRRRIVSPYGAKTSLRRYRRACRSRCVLRSPDRTCPRRQAPDR